MHSQSMPVGVLVSRHPRPKDAQCEVVRPLAVVTDMPTLPDWTLLRRDGAAEVFYAGESHLVLHPGEAAHYEDNLALDPPRVWVAIRPDADHPGTIAALSLDPYEGEAMADVEGDTVEALPMPMALRAWLAEFILQFPPNRTFYKRQRNKAGDRAGAFPHESDGDGE